MQGEELDHSAEKAIVSTGAVDQPLHDRLNAIVRDSPVLGIILQRWDEIALPDCWLVAGALAQSVWNASFGLPPMHGISDIDLVYFDGQDLTEDGEAEQARRIAKMFQDLPVRLDVKNEARVHLWYAEKFGKAIAAYSSTIDAITTFPTTATAVGVRPAGAGLDVVAPYGLDDLMRCTVRANKKQITFEIYEAKVRRWRGLWPDLTVLDWTC